MASIDSASLMTTIAALKKELARLEEQVSAAGGTVSFSAETKGKTKKVKKERDPDAPPPKENPYFSFLNGRLRPLLKEARADMPGTVPVAFAKHLLDSLAEGASKTEVYEMESSSILEAFEAWAADPEHLKAPARKAKDSGSESGSVAGDSGSEAPKERKKRGPMSDEAKAAMKAKREATLAKKKAEAEPEAAAPEPKAAAPEPKAAAPEPKAAAPEPEAAAPEPKAAEPEPKAKKTIAKKVVKKEFTLEQLQDFDEKEIEGETYGVNPRGDVVDGDGAFVGHWDGAVLNTKAPKPADWDKILA